jgi:hypothetical protein
MILLRASPRVLAREMLVEASVREAGGPHHICHKHVFAPFAKLRRGHFENSFATLFLVIDGVAHALQDDDNHPMDARKGAP